MGLSIRRPKNPMHAALACISSPVIASPEVTILLVDDQPAVRFGLQLLFELEPEPLHVWEAGSGAEAFALVERVRPDVVIMDVDLPDHNGITATQHVKQLLPGCLVIMLTIHSGVEVRSRALAAGAWAFVEKGKPEEMRATIHRAIQCIKGAPASSVLTTRQS